MKKKKPAPPESTAAEASALYLIATPIGNLGDFSFRAVETIKTLDYLLCEDTRRTRILLKHYQLDVEVRTFNAYKEKKWYDRVVQDVGAGKRVGLVSDAGTPGISDPGSRLVTACRAADLPVISLPGPCAAITALAASGFESSRFQFLGFLPRKKGALQKLFQQALDYPGTTVCYESPYRLVASLRLLAALAPSRHCAVAREMTKKFEEYQSGSAEALLSYFSQTTTLRGEIVLMISP